MTFLMTCFRRALYVLALAVSAGNGDDDTRAGELVVDLGAVRRAEVRGEVRPLRAAARENR